MGINQHADVFCELWGHTTVAPQLENTDPRNRGTIDTRYSSTSVSGRLGEWIPLGGANDNRSGSGRRLLASTRHHDANIYGVRVKVEQID